MEDCDLRVAPPIRQPVARDAPDQVVAAHHPKYVRATFIGELRIARSRRDHEDSCLIINLGGWNGGAGARVAGDEHHAITDELPSSSDGLIAATVVVGQNQTDRLTKNTAHLVEI